MKTLIGMAIATAFLGLCFALTISADESEQKLADPGYRPASDLSTAFVKGVSSAEIAVFPTIIRTPEDTSYSSASQQRAVEFLRMNNLGTGKAAGIQFDMGDLQGRSQWEMFQSSMQTIGKQLGEHEVEGDYVIVLEILIPPSRSEAIAVFGIHCFVLEPGGANAFSFLLNSHHKAFVDANLHTSDVTPEGKERLVIESTKVVLTALKEQIDQARESAADTADTGEVRTRLPVSAVYEDGFGGMPWIPSGWMGSIESLTLDGAHADNPHAGKACIKMRFTGDVGSWVGVAWQHPANNWGDLEGGYDLTGATYLELWARGEFGGERMNIGVGLLGADTAHPDSGKTSVEDLVLKREWQRYRIPLKKIDLSSIKTGFVVTLAGQRTSVNVYLDSIRFF